jgi:D-alanyl-D-alanine carboxypeptidase
VRVRGQRGQALPLVVVIVFVAGLASLVVAELGVRAVAGARARTAADAAALAAAAEGPRAGAELARANGSASAVVTGGVGDATVTARVGELHATARAESQAASGTAGLTAAMAAAVRRAGALLGRPVPITSGWRSYAQQAVLWARRATNPYPVARPGTSMHERGLAIDVPLGFVAVLRSVAALAGLCQPLPTSDPVHFELCNRRNVRTRAGT